MKRAFLLVVLCASCGLGVTATDNAGDPSQVSFGAASAVHSHADPKRTPGDIDSTLTVAQICKAGATADRRIASKKTRDAVLKAYGITATQRSTVVLDDLIPLELGGKQTAKNLWPEPVAEARFKDQIENRLHRDLCAGRLTVLQAQQQMIDEWR